MLNTGKRIFLPVQFVMFWRSRIFFVVVSHVLFQDVVFCYSMFAVLMSQVLTLIRAQCQFAVFVVAFLCVHVLKCVHSHFAVFAFSFLIASHCVICVFSCFIHSALFSVVFCVLEIHCALCHASDLKCF